MSPCPRGIAPKRVSFPRVSGDEPRRLYLLGTVREFSPRERG